MDYGLIKAEDYVIGYCRILGERSYKTEHETAYRLLDELLLDVFCVKADTLSMQKQDGGKPYFKDSDIFFNISHCHDLAVCVVSRKCDVGVDVEAVKAYRENMVKRIMSDREYEYFLLAEDKNKAFCQIWTYKESVLKLTGEGLRKELKEVDSRNDKKYHVEQYELKKDGREYVISCAIKI